MFFTGTSRFKPIRLLGTGGMGSVHLVRDEQLGTEVALKTLKLSTGTELYRFKREFRAVADIKHPNLVTLYELISEGPLWFFTMEYVPGLPFDQFLLGARNSSTVDAAGMHFDSDCLLQTVQQLCVGVHAMHEAGCIHRDIKPSNVLVTEEGRVVILDFGLAKQMGSGTVSAEGFSGTPAYMAPEQALEKRCLPSADWYAVGTMLYEVLTGRCPFEGAMFDVLLRKQSEDPVPPVELNPNADEALSDLCMRLIHRDPLTRPLGQEILVRLGVCQDRVTTRRMRMRKPTPIAIPALNIVGREKEIQALYRGYSRMRKGELAVVAVEGSSGIGKTCLVESFLDDIQSAGAPASAPLILRGRCHERETLPFKAFDNVVDGLSYRLVSLSGDDQAYVLPDGILYLGEIFPVLRRLKLTEHKRYFLPALRDAKELRNQAFVACCELLRRMARTQPIVIFIDDLHWADRDSFSLLRAITQQPGAPAILLVVSFRNNADQAAADPMLREFTEQPGLETITLGALSPDSTFALVTHLLDDEDMAMTMKRKIANAAVKEAEGNPFFIVELVHHLRTRVAARAGAEGSADGNAFSLDSMILARVGDLPEESQRLLRVIAVAGDPLPQRALAGASGLTLGSDAWELGISSLEEQSLVRRRGRQGSDVVDAYHDRIREVVVASLDEATSRQLHVQLAQAVEQWERERTDMLARFWLSADDQERAKRYACEAAAEARTKLAFDRAAQLYQTAATLETDDDACAELYRALGDCQAATGCAVAAADAYQQAAERSHPTQASRLRHLAAEQLLRGGEIARGMAVLTQVLKEAGLALAPGPRRAALSVAWRLVRLRLRGVGFVERPASSISAEDKHLLDVLWAANIGLSVVDTLRGDDFLLRFVMLALKTGDIRRVAQGFATLAAQLAALGGARFGWAMRLASEAEVLARRSSDSATIGVARMCKAIVRYFAGEFDDAANDLLAVEQHFLTHCRGMSWELATTRSFACFSLRLSGRIRELCERFDRYTADADRTGDRYLATNLRTYQSIVWLIRDDPARAAKEIDGILDSWPKGVYHIQHFLYLYGRCEQALYADRPDLAWDYIRQEEAKLRRSALLKVSGIRIEYAFIYGRVALRMAEQASEHERVALLREARKKARFLSKAEHQTGVAMGAAIEAGARWLMPAMNRDEGLVAIERAVATAEAAGAMLLAESGRRSLGELLGGRRGEELRARSNGWMANQGVRNPARIAHLIAPGFHPQETR